MLLQDYCSQQLTLSSLTHILHNWKQIHLSYTTKIFNMIILPTNILSTKIPQMTCSMKHNRKCILDNGIAIPCIWVYWKILPILLLVYFKMICLFHLTPNSFYCHYVRKSFTQFVCMVDNCNCLSFQYCHLFNGHSIHYTKND